MVSARCSWRADLRRVRLHWKLTRFLLVRSAASFAFRASDVNRTYSFCPSYPRVLIVPAYVSDADLMAVSAFRSKKRVPVVCWSGPLPPPQIPPIRAVEDAHAADPSARPKRALLLRSAQPLTGLTGQRCAEDEALLQHACAAVCADRLLVIDCRPLANAVGQAAMGAGYENHLWYTSPVRPNALNVIREAQIQFLGVENIHVARKSHAAVEKLLTRLTEEEADREHEGWRTEVGVRVCSYTTNATEHLSSTTPAAAPASCSHSSDVHVSSFPAYTAHPPAAFPSLHPSAASWLPALHSSGHFTHLANLLAGVNQVLACLSQGITTLVHCSDGWDRTALVTSLSQLALDGYYRTVEGFIVLIEREFLSFGHRFADRLGHGHFSHEVSPIFLQFLDCVFQFVAQFPTHFQFDARLLLFLQYHAHAGLYATFMFNSEEERARNHVSERTRSVWSAVIERLAEFTSPLYGVGWADVHRPLTHAQRSYEPHAAFAALPLYADPATLYIDTKMLVLWADMYLGHRRPLLWNGNLISRSHSDPRGDVNAVQLYLDSVEKQEQLEVLQGALDAAEVRACMEHMLHTTVERDAQQQIARAHASAITAAIVERAVDAAEWMESEVARRVAHARASQFISVADEDVGAGADADTDMRGRTSPATESPRPFLLWDETDLRKRSSEVRACSLCKCMFGMTVWRHSCRACASACCDRCAPKKLHRVIPARRSEYKSGRGDEADRRDPEIQTVRVCRRCEDTQTAERSASRTPRKPASVRGDFASNPYAASPAPSSSTSLLEMPGALLSTLYSYSPRLIAPQFQPRASTHSMRTEFTASNEVSYPHAMHSDRHRDSRHEDHTPSNTLMQHSAARA